MRADLDTQARALGVLLARGLVTYAEAMALAEVEVAARVGCATCGGRVEPERRCYAIPTCYRCLPPPEPLPIAPWPPKRKARS